ncbi:MAG: hypothetical protein QM500_11455 [Methylococcales bacterium]
MNFKMEVDLLVLEPNTEMNRFCKVISLSLDYADLLKGNPEIKTNDIEVWGALFNRYLTGL